MSSNYSHRWSASSQGTPSSSFDGSEADQLQQPCWASSNEPQYERSTSCGLARARSRCSSRSVFKTKGKSNLCSQLSKDSHKIQNCQTTRRTPIGNIKFKSRSGSGGSRGDFPRTSARMETRKIVAKKEYNSECRVGGGCITQSLINLKKIKVLEENDEMINESLDLSRSTESSSIDRAKLEGLAEKVNSVGRKETVGKRSLSVNSNNPFTTVWIQQHREQVSSRRKHRDAAELSSRIYRQKRQPRPHESQEEAEFPDLFELNQAQVERDLEQGAGFRATGSNARAKRGRAQGQQEAEEFEGRIGASEEFQGQGNGEAISVSGEENVAPFAHDSRPRFSEPTILCRPISRQSSAVNEANQCAAKRTIAGHFKENDFFNKDLNWRMDLIKQAENSKSAEICREELASLSSDGCTCIPNSSNYKDTLDNKLRKGDKSESELLKMARRNWTCKSGDSGKLSATENFLVEAFKGLDSPEHVFACATAAITANFSPTLTTFSTKKEHQCIDPSTNRIKSSYQEQKTTYFNYPPSPTSSTIYQSQPRDVFYNNLISSSQVSPSSSTGSNGSGKRPLTKRLNMQPRSRSIQKSIDNLRLLVEKNMVASLIGVYIFVSLMIIIVLILPHIFNLLPYGDKIFLKDAAILDHPVGSSETAIKSSQQIELVHNELLEHRRSVEVKTSPLNVKDQSTMTDNGDQLQPSASKLLSENPTIKYQQQTALAGINKGFANRKRGTRINQPVAIIENSTIQTPETSTIPISHPTSTMSSQEPLVGSTKVLGWNQVYNQQCQPLKIPFCSKSLNSMLDSNHDQSKFGSEAGIYDKTLLPNQFGNVKQWAVERALAKYLPIMDIRCYPLMPLFLCSIYAPKCNQLNETEVKNIKESQDNNQTMTLMSFLPSFIDSNDHRSVPKNNSPAGVKGSSSAPVRFTPANSVNVKSDYWARLVPPCRSLCREAIRKCVFFFEVLSLKLANLSDCDALPESSDSNVCIGHVENNSLQKSLESQYCHEDKFRCTDGDCIPRKWRCDGFADCTDKSDELKCSRCNAETQFYCGQDVCISKRLVCNGIRDCRDGRDERQCLRLSNAAEGFVGTSQNKNNSYFNINTSGPIRQLEVWSAVGDMWLPVCGAHWSPMTMSHEACQALGYSRANETLILYGEDDGAQAPTEQAKSRNHAGQQTDVDYGSKLVTYPTSLSLLSGQVSEKLRANYRSPMAALPASSNSWFGSGSSDQQYSTNMQPDNDEQQLVDAVEDVASGLEMTSTFKSKLVNRQRDKSGDVDHFISYRRKNDHTNSDLTSADGNEVKLKSLTSMLFHGPQSGCLNQLKHLSSSVYLQCENFQCGRPITSYSSRVKQQPGGEFAKSTPSARMTSASSRMIAGPEASVEEDWTEEQNDASLSPLITSVTKRIPRLEADEEFDPSNEDSIETGDDEQYTTNENEFETSELNQSLIDSLANPLVSSRLVVGGTESMPGEFPYLAALHGGPDEVFFCGGVLISINWLLTAAHCVGNRTEPEGWMVKVGVTRRIASPAYVKKLKIRKIIKHSRFNQQSLFNNDIALILLEESVEFNQYLKPICLPRANLKLGPDNSKDCVVVGFGKSKFSQDANYLHVAHFVNVPIVHHSVCSTWYADHLVNLTEGMLCAGYAEGKRDACQGDSGSGLFCRHSQTNQFFVAGVVSFGIKCATPKLPGVYTSVPAYVDWIEKTTREHGYPLN